MKNRFTRRQSLKMLAASLAVTLLSPLPSLAASRVVSETLFKG
ncbi:hypothetical protein Q7C_2644 [Methylophaga frappieri]|uniref:Uncharacterized protein n=1 Tax=Methylophaga frappieri (strain ATCC BAA-2434 / DSM 25690 / JAM7) TaxID=754477 RepID=I1YLH2_METFJ|nr:hypothetical protein Q7C_2644 [Methylophaga frappieri]